MDVFAVVVSIILLERVHYLVNYSEAVAKSGPNIGYSMDQFVCELALAL